jgi:intron-binding protein aquarius
VWEWAQAQLPTRRFFLALIIDRQVVVRCRMSALAQRTEGRLYNQLLDLLKFYQDFEINEHTGVPLSRDEMLARHYGRLQLLQRHAFNLFPDSMKDFALANIGAIENRDALFAHLAAMPKEQLAQLLQKVRLMPADSPDTSWKEHSFLLQVATSYHERRISQLDAINALPLYPTEDLLWDENVVPSINYTGEQVLALPKLNLQYLTLHDYLLRNFNLFRLESTYEIRQDVEDVALRLRPRLDGTRTIFQGWSRSSLPLSDFTVVEVAKPNLGETRPAHVLGEATYSLEGVRDQALRKEWENFREHDILFLLTIKAKYRVGEHPPSQKGGLR